MKAGRKEKRDEGTIDQEIRVSGRKERMDKDGWKDRWKRRREAGRKQGKGI